MTTATASQPAKSLSRTGRYSFLLHRLHSLTGIVFGGYVIVHLLINATLIEGLRSDNLRPVFDIQVEKIHSLPFLGIIEWTFIYFPILYHAIYGTWLALLGRPNALSYPYVKNTLYVVQRITAGIIVLFLLFHVLTMKGVFGANLEFNPFRATASTVHHFNASPIITWFIYPVGILTATFHLANGFYTAAISWGLTVSAGAMRRWAVVCVALFVLATGAGLTAWVATLGGHGTPIALQPH